MSKFPLIEQQMKNNIPDFRPGDTVRVEFKIKEGDMERVSSFEGIVIRERGEGLNKTFTVRKISFGVGVERIFPLHSPSIVGIEVLRPGKVRRAKLYYLRKQVGSVKVERGKERLKPQDIK